MTTCVLVSIIKSESEGEIGFKFDRVFEFEFRIFELGFKEFLNYLF